MNSVYTIDIAHPPCSGDEAEGVLSESLRKVQCSSHFRILRIIHGYGSGGKGGVLKLVVQNWLFRNRAIFKVAIDGASVSQFNKDVQQLCVECNLNVSNDLISPNNGITIVWVK